MGAIDERLAELGLELPDAFEGPPGMALKFDLVRVVGDVAYVSGHGPTDGPRVLIQGKGGQQLLRHSSTAPFTAARSVMLTPVERLWNA